MKTTLYLIRHAQSRGNALWEQSQTRLPKTELGSDLTDLGMRQAQNLASELQTVAFTAIYSSQLKRARHTASILKGDRDLTVKLDIQLREREEDEEKDQEAIDRFTAKLHELVSAHPGETIAVVAHGFVIRGFLSHLGVKPLAEMPHGYIQNTGHLQFEVEDGDYTVISTQRVG